MVETKNQPKWATLDRQAYLVSLFDKCGGFCVYGHKPCLVPEHHYELFIESLIWYWIADDRATDFAEWEAEQKYLHNLGELRYPLRGQFSAIARHIYADSQPLYYLEALGISGLTFTPFAKVRIASSYMRLYIDLGDALKRVSKNKRRKAIRYGKPLPEPVETNVSVIISQAVKDYIAH
ncbi:hypothetical protein ES703_64086 [subsurface metagenome]